MHCVYDVRMFSIRYWDFSKKKICYAINRMRNTMAVCRHTFGAVLNIKQAHTTHQQLMSDVVVDEKNKKQTKKKRRI